MNDTVRFLVVSCAIVATSVYWLLCRSSPQAIGRGIASAFPGGTSRTSIGLVVGIPAAVVALYLHFGDFEALSGPPPDPLRAMAEERTEVLAGRLATGPVDVDGLRLLARSYEQLGRWQPAVRTRERLVALRPEDPDALVDLADTLSLAQGGSYVGEPIETVRRALSIDGASARALATIANEAAERGDLATAIRAWDGIESQVPPDSAIGRSLRADIDGARSELAAGASTPTAPAVKTP